MPPYHLSGDPSVPAWLGVLAVAVAAILLFVGLRMLRDKQDEYFWGVSIVFTLCIAVAYGALLKSAL